MTEFIEITTDMKFENPHVKDTGWTVLRDCGPAVDLKNERTGECEIHSKSTIRSYLERGLWIIV